MAAPGLPGTSPIPVFFLPSGVPGLGYDPGRSPSQYSFSQLACQALARTGWTCAGSTAERVGHAQKRATVQEAHARRRPPRDNYYLRLESPSNKNRSIVAIDSFLPSGAAAGHRQGAAGHAQGAQRSERGTRRSTYCPGGTRLQTEASFRNTLVLCIIAFAVIASTIHSTIRVGV